jgi:hypothetical protein
MNIIFISCIAAEIASKMPDAIVEGYSVDSSQPQVNLPSAAVAVLLP